MKSACPSLLVWLTRLNWKPLRVFSPSPPHRNRSCSKNKTLHRIGCNTVSQRNLFYDQNNKEKECCAKALPKGPNERICTGTT